MFENSQPVKTLIKNVNERLGFTIVGKELSPREDEDMNELDFKDLQLIYDICRFEAAWYPQNISYWCASFSEDDLKVLCCIE